MVSDVKSVRVGHFETLSQCAPELPQGAPNLSQGAPKPTGTGSIQILILGGPNLYSGT